MQDPLTFPDSLATMTPTTLGPPTPPMLPSAETPPPPSTAAPKGLHPTPLPWSPWPDLPDVTGLRVLSGTGEDLGTALGVVHDRHGHPKWLAFTEDGIHTRKVQLRWVRGVTTGTIRLAGPREGYHITRVMRDLDQDG